MLELLRHAVGHNGFRNYYASNPDGDVFDAWELMVGLGLAKRGHASARLVHFHVSRPGIAFLKKLSPRKYKRELGRDPRAVQP